MPCATRWLASCLPSPVGSSRASSPGRRTCSASSIASSGVADVSLFAKILKVGLVTEALDPAELSAVELVSDVEASTRRLLGRALAIRQVDAGSCNGCELEIGGLTSPVYDLERFGVHFVASPRHADLLLVTGPVTRNMAEALRRTWQATPDPKFVVAVGDCARDGGIFAGSYAV